MTKTLNVRNLEQAALWLELDGQISDGNWENARPANHWVDWCHAKVAIDSSNVGRDFYPRKDNYNFADPELLRIVGPRMLAIVRIARRFGIAVASVLEHAPDCETGDIDTDKPYLAEDLDVAMRLAGYNSCEKFGLALESALSDKTYTVRQMKADLVDLKAIVRTRRTGMNCPECNSVIVIDDRAETEIPWFCPNPGGIPYIETRRVRVTVAFCSGCEWVHEIDPKFLKGRTA